ACDPCGGKDGCGPAKPAGWAPPAGCDPCSARGTIADSKGSKSLRDFFARLTRGKTACGPCQPAACK
ncbi:MAG: hypothetical protein K2X87_04190, partial [Gemmataceae bacterium]|nr:hypothetical protein [Gemmataceae bacterium]